MVFNATFNNISVLSCWSVLLVEETGVPAENHRPVASHWQTVSHNVLSSTPRLSGIRTHSVSFSLECPFIKAIQLLCLTVLIILFPFLWNIYSLDVTKLVKNLILYCSNQCLNWQCLRFCQIFFDFFSQTWTDVNKNSFKTAKTRNISEIKGFTSNLCLGYSNSSQWR